MRVLTSGFAEAMPFAGDKIRLSLGKWKNMHVFVTVAMQEQLNYSIKMLLKQLCIILI